MIIEFLFRVLIHWVSTSNNCHASANNGTSRICLLSHKVDRLVDCLVQNWSLSLYVRLDSVRWKSLPSVQMSTSEPVGWNSTNETHGSHDWWIHEESICNKLSRTTIQHLLISLTSRWTSIVIRSVISFVISFPMSIRILQHTVRRRRIYPAFLQFLSFYSGN